MVQDVLTLYILVPGILYRCSSASIWHVSWSLALTFTLAVTQDVSIHSWLLSYYVEHAVLQCLFVFREEVLLPRVVADVWV